MMFYSSCILYCTIIWFGLVDYYFAVNDFDLNRIPEREPTHLENITKLFIQQYKHGVTSTNKWNELRKNLKDTRWKNLCNQSWHKRDDPEFRYLHCAAIEMTYKTRPASWIITPNGKKLEADLLKCGCPFFDYSKQRVPVNNTDHSFYLARHSDLEYFSLIYASHRSIIIHGFVRNFRSPFNTTLSPINKVFYTEEAQNKYRKLRRKITFH